MTLMFNVKRLFSVFFFYSIIIVFPVSHAAFALDFRFERIDSRSGLSGNSVSGVIQDKRGFIWFATQDGLSRYDGREFLVFQHEPFNPDSLRHNLIQTIFYDTDSDLIWLGTYGGLCVFDPVTEKINHSLKVDNSEVMQLLDSGVITAIEKDRDGYFWIGALDGLARINPATGSSMLFKGSQGKDIPESYYKHPNSTVRDILCDSYGRIWIATYNGLVLYEKGIFTSYLLRKTLPEKDSEISVVITISEYSPGQLLLGSWGGGITVFNTESGEYSNRKTGNDRFYIIKNDSRGHIWAGTWGSGLYYFDSIKELKEGKARKASYEHDNRYSISNDIIYSMYEDKSGLMWIGTNGGGVNKLNQLQRDYRYLYAKGTESSLGNDSYRAILSDSSGMLWIGSYSTGLYLHNPSDGSIRHFVHNPADKNSLSDNTINAVFSDSRNNIWVLTNSGLNLYNREKRNFDVFYYSAGKIGKLPKEGIAPESAGISSNFYSMTEDSLGRYWIGTYSSGVYVWDREADSVEQYTETSGARNRISNNLVYALGKDKNGNIWIGTNRGLNRFEADTGDIRQYFHNPEDPYSLCNNSVRVLYSDTKGNLWIGTAGGGISMLGPVTDVFYNFSTKDGLDHNTVTGILEDSRNNILAVTVRGISLIERIHENKFSSATSLSYQFGLSGIEFRGGLTKDGTGSVFVASAGEIYKLDTLVYYSNRFNPEIIITDLVIFDKSYIELFGKNVFVEDTVNLSWKDNHISFKFTSIDYTFPSGRKYKYMLEGFDRGWIYSDERNYTSYTSIPPGEYKFRVTGTNSSGIWGTKEASLRLIIKPPLYRTPLAYFLYMATALLLFYGIVMIVRGKEAERQLAEVSRLRDELVSLNLQLDQQARIDILTGVSNRRHFNEVFGNLFDLFTRTGVNFSILMLDIDYFKKFNDTYGHLAGDRCLREVAQTILETVNRKTDSVFRYGGEEFAVLLVDSSCSGAKVVAGRIKDRIMEKKIENRLAESTGGYLTVSIGVACAKSAVFSTPDELLIEADKKLYRAKEEGRNRIV